MCANLQWRPGNRIKASLPPSAPASFSGESIDVFLRQWARDLHGLLPPSSGLYNYYYMIFERPQGGGSINRALAGVDDIVRVSLC